MRSKPAVKVHFKTGSQLRAFNRIECSPKGGQTIDGKLQEHGCNECDTRSLQARVDEKPDRPATRNTPGDGGAACALGREAAPTQLRRCEIMPGGGGTPPSMSAKWAVRLAFWRAAPALSQVEGFHRGRSVVFLSQLPRRYSLSLPPAGRKGEWMRLTA